MKSRFLLDVVIGKSATVLELLASEDQSLLVRGDTFLVLDFLLHSLDGIGGLDFESDSLTGERFDEDLHTTTKAQDQVESRLLLDVVIGKSATVLELLASEDQSLLVRGDTFLVLNLLFHGLDGIGGLNFESDSLTGEGLDEDLHTTTKAQDQVESRLLLDVVIGKSATVLELLASEDQSLLVRGNTFLVLNFLLDGLDGVGGLDLKGNCLSRQSFHEDLHTTTKAQDQVESRLLLDVVIGKSATVLELLAGEDQSLLVRGDTFLVLNLLFHGLDGVGRLDFESDSLPGEGLDENLHGCCSLVVVLWLLLLC